MHLQEAFYYNIAAPIFNYSVLPKRDFIAN